MTDEKWVAATVPGIGARFLVRAKFNGDRWVATGFWMESDEITSRTLRRPPLNAATTALAADAEIAAAADSGQGLSEALRTLLASAPDATRPPCVVREPLRRPDRSDPEGHARTTAIAYQEAVRAGRDPGPAMAAEAGVPVCTVYGWIKQARLRGFLPPGQRGKAG